jgi:transcriptional regulator with XRE-family HTH domain
MVNLDKQEFLNRLGKAIRVRRVEVELTQEQLANQSDLDRSYVGGVERGERNVSIFNVAKIASGLDISLAELFSDLSVEDAR